MWLIGVIIFSQLTWINAQYDPEEFAAERAQALTEAMLNPAPAFAAYPNYREARGNGFGQLQNAFTGFLGGGGNSGGGGSRSGGWFGGLFNGLSTVVDKAAQFFGAPKMPDSVKQSFADGPRSPVQSNTGFPAPRMTRPGADVFRRLDARKKKIKGRVKRQGVSSKVMHGFQGPVGRVRNTEFTSEATDVIRMFQKWFSGLGNLGATPVSRVNQKFQRMRNSGANLYNKVTNDLPNAAFGVMRSKRSEEENKTNDIPKENPIENILFPADEHGRPVEFAPAPPVPFKNGSTVVVPVPVDEKGNTVEFIHTPPEPFKQGSTEFIPVPVDEKGNEVEFIRAPPKPFKHGGMHYIPVPVDEQGRPVEFVRQPPPFMNDPNEVVPVPVDEQGNAVEFVPSPPTPFRKHGTEYIPVPVDEHGTPVQRVHEPLPSKTDTKVIPIPVDEHGNPVEFVPEPPKPFKHNGTEYVPVPVDARGNPVEFVPSEMSTTGTAPMMDPSLALAAATGLIPPPPFGSPLDGIPMPVDENGLPMEFLPTGPPPMPFIHPRQRTLLQRSDAVEVPVDENGTPVEFVPSFSTKSPDGRIPVPVDETGTPVEFIPMMSRMRRPRPLRVFERILLSITMRTPRNKTLTKTRPSVLNISGPTFENIPISVASNNIPSAVQDEMPDSFSMETLSVPAGIPTANIPIPAPFIPMPPMRTLDTDVNFSLQELAVAHQENWFNYLATTNKTVECQEYNYCTTAKINKGFKTAIARNGGKLLSLHTAKLREKDTKYGKRISQAVECCLSNDPVKAESCENYYHEKCLRTDLKNAAHM